LDLSARYRIEQICDEFESAWRKGPRPQLKTLLAGHSGESAEREVLLRELISLDVHYRKQAGDPPKPQDYAAFFLTVPPAWFREVFTTVSPANDIPTLTAGDLIILEEIGRGGMGIVYRGYDPHLKRELAIKILNRNDQEDLVQRFLREARITGQLQHPGVVPVYGLGRLPDGRPCLLMKRINGQTLAAILAERSPEATVRDPIFRQRLLGIFEQICRTMDSAHSRRIIHRDLKPSNVMVGAFGEVQVMDWGLAKNLVEDSLPSSGLHLASTGQVAERGGTAEKAGSHTQSGYVLGTPAWMAPEQARGEIDQLDERTDVFALGAILCRILTGYAPRDGEEDHSLLDRVISGDLSLAQPRLLSCGADPELIALTLRCLAPRAEDRPRNAGELAVALENQQTRIREALQRAQQAAAAAQARAEEQARRSQVERRLRRITTWLVLLVLGVVAVTILGSWWWNLREDALAGSVDTELAQSVSLQERALEPAVPDVMRLREAISHSARAEELLRQSPIQTQRLRNLLTHTSELLQKQRAELADIEEDSRFAAELLELSWPLSGALDFEAKDARKVPVELSETEYFDDLMRRNGILLSPGQLAETLQRVRSRKPFLIAQLVCALAQETRRRQVLGLPESSWETLLSLTEQLDIGLPGSQRRQRLRWLWTSQQLRQETLCHWASLVGRGAGLGPWAALAYPNVGQQWQWLNSQTEKETFAQIVRNEPRWSVQWLAVLLDSVGARSEARDVLRRALQISPDDVSLWVQLSGLIEMASAKSVDPELLVCWNTIRALRPDSGIKLAKILAEMNRPNEAVDLLLEMLRNRPDSSETWLALGQIQHNQLAQHLQAETSHRRAARLRPDWGWPWYCTAMALEAQNQPGEAESAYRQAAKLDPKNGRILAQLALLLQSQKRYQEALEMYPKTLELNPSNPRPWSNVALLYEQIGQPGKALEHHRRAVEIDPNYPNALNNLGTFLYSRNNPKHRSEAETLFRRAIMISPNYALAHSNLGNVLKDRKQFSEAESCYRRAISLDPKLPTPRNNLGWLLAETNRRDEAEAVYREAVRIIPNDSELWYNLGTFQLETRQLSEGIESLRRALLLRPDRAEAHCNLGLALLTKGDYADALVAIQEGHRLGTKQPNWPYPSAIWLIEARRVRGGDLLYQQWLKSPNHNFSEREYADLGYYCRRRGDKPLAAFSFYQRALATTKRPELHRLPAAEMALRAGLGIGDARDLRKAQQRGYRRIALTWYRQELAWRIEKNQPISHDTWFGEDLLGGNINRVDPVLDPEEREAWKSFYQDLLRAERAQRATKAKARQN
jgi:serine/threonine protein kinase